MMDLLQTLWSVPGSRVLVIVIAIETLFISATILWLVVQNRHHTRYHRKEEEFSETLAPRFDVALDSTADLTLDEWHSHALEYPRIIVRDFLHHAVLRASDTERARLVQHYRDWGYVERDHHLLSLTTARKRLFALRRLHAVARPEDCELLLKHVGDDYLERVLTAQVVARIGSAADVIDLVSEVEIHSGLMEQPIYATFEQMGAARLADIFDHRHRFKEPRIHRILLEVAAAQGVGSASRVVVLAAESNSTEERIGACNAASFLDEQIGERILLNGIDDADWRVRARAAKILRRFPSDNVLAELSNAMTDEAFWVRQNAANSLRWTGDEGRQRLEAIEKSSEDPFAVDAAAQELQRYRRFSSRDQRHFSIAPRGVS